MSGFDFQGGPQESLSSGTFDIEILNEEPQGATPLSLPPGTAADLAGNLAKLVARAGARAPKDAVYRLVPSRELAQGLANRTLRYASPASGDASVLIKDAVSGKIAGKASLKGVRAQPGALLGPAAWQVLALATQQHFLVEISQRMKAIEDGIADMTRRMRAELGSALKAYSEEAERLRGRHEQGLTLDRHDRAQIDELLVKVGTIWRQALSPFKAQLSLSRDDVDPGKYFADFETAFLAFQVQAQLANLKITAHPPKHIDLAVDEERRRFLAALPEIQEVASLLVDADNRVIAQQAAYTRDKDVLQGPIGKFSDSIFGSIRLLRNSVDPPKFKKLRPDQRKMVEGLARPLRMAPEPLLVRVTGRGEVVVFVTPTS